MIVRMWRGRALRDDAEVYQRHVTAVVLPKLLRIDGYLGGRVLRRPVDAEVEFLVITEWASWDAIRAFAGARLDVAVVDPEAKAVLSHADTHVQHFEPAFHACAS